MRRLLPRRRGRLWIGGGRVIVLSNRAGQLTDPAFPQRGQAAIPLAGLPRPPAPTASTRARPGHPARQQFRQDAGPAGAADERVQDPTEPGRAPRARVNLIDVTVNPEPDRLRSWQRLTVVQVAHHVDDQLARQRPPPVEAPGRRTCTCLLLPSRPDIAGDPAGRRQARRSAKPPWLPPGKCSYQCHDNGAGPPGGCGPHRLAGPELARLLQPPATRAAIRQADSVVTAAVTGHLRRRVRHPAHAARDPLWCSGLYVQLVHDVSFTHRWRR